MTKTAELWRKEAQAGLDRAKVPALASGGTDRLAEYWKSLSPETRRTLVNTVLGGAAGGGAMGVMGALAAPEGRALHRGISSAMLGSVLGSLAGGAGTAAYEAVAKGRSLPGEVKGTRPLGDTLSDKVVGGMIHNPALTTGTVAGGYLTATGLDRVLGIANRMDEANRTLRPGERLATLARGGAALGLGGAARVAALPAGMTLGYLIDRYIKGNYE